MPRAAVLDFAVDRRPRAACHPDRPRVRKLGGLCLDCLNAGRREHKGLPATSGFIPERIPGVEQRALTYVPSRCPKCRSPHLVIEGRSVHCPGTFAGCGGTWFLVAK